MRLRRRAERMEQREKYDPRLRRKQQESDIAAANNLCEACREGDKKAVKMLLVEYSANPNCRDRARAWV